MSREKPKNCWEFMKCKNEVREKCPAYTTNSGKECWMVADSFKKDSCYKVKEKFKSCLECAWFNKLNKEI